MTNGSLRKVYINRNSPDVNFISVTFQNWKVTVNRNSPSDVSNPTRPEASWPFSGQSAAIQATAPIGNRCRTARATDPGWCDGERRGGRRRTDGGKTLNRRVQRLRRQMNTGPVALERGKEGLQVLGGGCGQITAKHGDGRKKWLSASFAGFRPLLSGFWGKYEF